MVQFSPILEILPMFLQFKELEIYSISIDAKSNFVWIYSGFNSYKKKVWKDWFFRFFFIFHHYVDSLFFQCFLFNLSRQFILSRVLQWLFEINVCKSMLWNINIVSNNLKDREKMEISGKMTIFILYFLFVKISVWVVE